jgi:tetratricopeptide (TPR) repeat protein
LQQQASKIVTADTAGSGANGVEWFEQLFLPDQGLTLGCDALQTQRDERVGVTTMKRFANKFAGILAAVVVVGLTAFATPGDILAQGTAAIHGHVQNPAGQPVTSGEVRLTTDKNPNSTSIKFDYTFPIDGSGNYKGADIKPGNYTAIVYQGANHIDFMPAQLAAGDDKTIDFDMTRKEYIDKMSPADREALEEYKKKNAEAVAANQKIGNLNNLLKTARADTAAGNYDAAIKAMNDATAAKPDEPILWETLGDAQLGAANLAAKTAKDNKTTDASLPDKYSAAEASYQKALDLNAKAAKPNPEVAAAANNQMGQALAKMGKTKDAAAAYEAAAKADPAKAGTYYFNEAATLFNASDMDDAAIAADKAIAADPTKVEAYYIKGQALVQKATVDPKTNKITAPPDCVAAYQKYLELAPNGPHAEEIKGILQGIGEPIKSSYKAPKK